MRLSLSQKIHLIDVLRKEYQEACDSFVFDIGLSRADMNILAELSINIFDEFLQEIMAEHNDSDLRTVEQK
jgi:hypothetical protein